MRLVRRLSAPSLFAVAMGGCGTTTMFQPSDTTPVGYVTPEILNGRWSGTFKRSNIMWVSATPVQQPTTMSISGEHIRWRFQGSRGRWYGSNWSNILIDGTAYFHIAIRWSDIDPVDETVPVQVTENADAYFMTGRFNIGGANDLIGDFLVRRPKAPPIAANCLEEAAVPDDVEVLEPAPDVPSHYARFFGLWSNGRWDSGVCNSLLVSSIDADGNADVVYAWGTSAEWRVYEPGFVKVEARV